MSDEAPDLDREKKELENRKLKAELRQLEGHFLFRNPQVVTAAISVIGALIGIYILGRDNYWKNLQDRVHTEEVSAADAKRRADAAIEASKASVAQSAKETAKALKARKTAEDAKVRTENDYSRNKKELAGISRALRGAKEELETELAIGRLRGLVNRLDVTADTTEPLSMSDSDDLLDAIEKELMASVNKRQSLDFVERQVFNNPVVRCRHGVRGLDSGGDENLRADQRVSQVGRRAIREATESRGV